MAVLTGVVVPKAPPAVNEGVVVLGKDVDIGEANRLVDDPVVPNSEGVGVVVVLEPKLKGDVDVERDGVLAGLNEKDGVVVEGVVVDVENRLGKPPVVVVGVVVVVPKSEGEGCCCCGCGLNRFVVPPPAGVVPKRLVPVGPGVVVAGNSEDVPVVVPVAPPPKEKGLVPPIPPKPVVEGVVVVAAPKLKPGVVPPAGVVPSENEGVVVAAPKAGVVVCPKREPPVCPKRPPPVDGVVVCPKGPPKEVPPVVEVAGAKVVPPKGLAVVVGVVEVAPKGEEKVLPLLVDRKEDVEGAPPPNRLVPPAPPPNGVVVAGVLPKVDPVIVEPKAPPNPPAEGSVEDPKRPPVIPAVVPRPPAAPIPGGLFFLL